MKRRIMFFVLWLIVLNLLVRSSEASTAPDWEFGDPILSSDFRIESVSGCCIEVLFNRSLTGQPQGQEEETQRALIAIPQSALPSITATSASYQEWRRNELLSSGTLESASLNIELGDLIHVEPLGVVRHWRLATLSLNPCRKAYAGDPLQTRLFTQIRFQLVYPPEFDFSTSSSDDLYAQRDGFLSLFSKFPLLGSMPLARLSLPAPTAPQPNLWEDSLDRLVSESGVKVFVREEGLVKLSLEKVLDAAKGTSLTLDNIQIYKKGKVIPSYWSEDRSALYFWNVESRSAFSRDSVYWLVSDATPIVRDSLAWAPMPAQPEPGSATPSRIPFTNHYEEDKVFAQQGPKDETQTKFWQWSKIDEEQPAEVKISAPGIVSDTFEVTFRLGRDPAGADPNWTEIEVSFAGQPIKLSDLTTRPDEHGMRHTLKVSRSLFPPDSGQEWTLKIHANERLRNFAKSTTDRFTRMYLDWVEISYQRSLVMESADLTFQDNQSFEEALPPDPQGRSPFGYQIAVNDLGDKQPVAFKIGQDGDGEKINTYWAEGLLCVPVRDTTVENASSSYRIALRTNADIESPVTVKPHAPAGLRLPENRADYLIITHEKFLNTAKPLALMYASQGIQCRVVNVEDIYDEFVDGTTSPIAIKRFLTYALRFWSSPAPSDVLLLGDASWDYWGRLPAPLKNYVPGYRMNPDYASDNWYCCVEGEDALPDYHFGRISVQEVEQAENAVGKALAYMNGLERGSWESQAVFFADNDFEAGMERVMERQTPPYLAKKSVQLREFEFVDNFYMPEVLTIQEKSKTSPKCTKRLLDLFSEGCLLFEFYGHGSPNVLCHERVFFGGGSKFSDVKKMLNGNRLPFMLLMTCDTGHFDYAEPKWNLCIAEELLSHKSGGAVGALVSTGRGFPGHHEGFMRAFHESLFYRDVREIGALTTAVKILFKMLQESDDPLNMFEIFGDPRTKLRLPDVAGTLTVSPSEFQSRYGGRILASPEKNAQISGPQFAFISDAKGVLLPGSCAVTDQGSSFPVGFDLADNLPVGKCYASIFSASMSAQEPARVFLGSFESLPRSSMPDGATTEQALPNLEVRTDGITFSDFSPINGQTVFLTIRVYNTGDAPARDVVVRAYDGTPLEGGKPLENTVNWLLDRISLIRPGESETVKLRWDPFLNAGEHVIWVEADPDQRIQEKDRKDNLASRLLTVRKKADLQVTGELVWNDTKQRTELNYAISNIGEETAEEFQLQLKGFRTDDDHDPVIKDFEIVRSVAPAGIRSGTGIGIPASFKKIELVVDPDDIVDEETHKNNMLELSPQPTPEPTPIQSPAVTEATPSLSPPTEEATGEQK